MKKYVFVCLAFSLSFTACNKDDYDFIEPEIAAQHFMWQAMNQWYLWQEDVPALADTQRDSRGEYTAFLRQTPNPADFFFNVLLSREDRFSFLNADYTKLVNNIAGVSKSNGLEFGVGEVNGTVLGYVQYIIPNSNASTQDIKRGDIFVRVDGQRLSENNYEALLFGDRDTYTLGMATITTNGEIEENGKEVSLTKIENQAEDPILGKKVLETGGRRIAYLMYNRFLKSSDEALNTAFGEFKSAGATDLVVDLRYNSGGDVNTSRLLASMIHSNNTQKVYARKRYNAKIQPLLSESQLVDFFAKTMGSIQINTLNLQKVYVLTTGISASASELLINGLDAHMEVVHIGERTRGKSEFSTTLVDDPGNLFVYDRQREREINTEHRWGLQPLVGVSENAAGFSVDTDGLIPNITLLEDLANMGVLGEPAEPLLARAIEDISGAASRRSLNLQMPANPFISSRLKTPLQDNMYVDPPLLPSAK